MILRRKSIRERVIIGGGGARNTILLSLIEAFHQINCLSFCNKLGLGRLQFSGGNQR